MSNGNRRIQLPNLNSSLEAILKVEGLVKSKIGSHHQIYDTVDMAIERYRQREYSKQGSGNTHDFQRSVYFAVYNAIIGLLHDRVGEDNGEQFKRDFAHFRKTADIRLDYVDALITAAFLATRDGEGVGLKYSNLIAWKNAKEQIAEAARLYATPHVKRDGPKINGKLDQAYRTLETLKQKAIKAYDKEIPR